jgi:hypothetical protein
MPTNVRATVVGGPTHRFWVDGEDRGAGSQGLDGPPAQPGVWRIEVEPSAGRVDADVDTVMVHALTVGEVGTPEIDVEPLPVTTDPVDPAPLLSFWMPDAVPSALASNAVLLTSGAVPRSALRYAAFDVPGGPAILAVLGGVPGATYRVSADGRLLPNAASSPEGVLTAYAPGPGRIVVGTCPPPSGAGPDWQALCRELPTPAPEPANGVLLPLLQKAAAGRDAHRELAP